MTADDRTRGRSPFPASVVLAPLLSVLIFAFLATSAGCSSNSSGGGSTELSGDAAVAYACGVANQPPETMCPVATGGTCFEGDCDLKSLPTGMACSGSRTCLANIDPCPDLQANSDTDYYACDCVEGRWVCGLCAAGGALCVDAGPADAPSEAP
jgi:hypothetical protein